MLDALLSEQVTSVMSSALRSTSKRNKIALKELRIKMQLVENLESTECYVLHKTNEIEALSWSKILGLKGIGFKQRIVGGITKRLHDVAEKNDIDKRAVNVRVYAVDSSGKPNVYLYDGGKPLKLIDIDKLL